MPAGRFWKPLRSPLVPSDLDRAAALESFRLIVPALCFRWSANDDCGDLTDSHRQGAQGIRFRKQRPARHPRPWREPKPEAGVAEIIYCCHREI